MKIGKINVKVSAVQWAVVITLTLILLVYSFFSGDFGILYWGLPMLLLLLIIPLALNYMSQAQYANLIPVYEKEARKVGIKAINLGMVGEPVRVEGVVERVHFKYLNRPQFLVADKTGEVSVKMFTQPQEDIRKGDIVEVLGIVIKRYMVTGDAAINCVSIRKIKKEKNS
jgi:hypothetical protein